MSCLLVQLPFLSKSALEIGMYFSTIISVHMKVIEELGQYFGCKWVNIQE